MVDCTAIKELLIPKTLNKLTYVLVVVWFVVGATLCVAFSEMEISESRYDIQCVAGKNPDIAFIRGKCSDQYRIENHKLGFPPYLFVIANVLLILLVPVFYSQIVKSTVDELERNPQDAQLQQRKTLFIAYLCQLIISIVLEITFIVLLETHLFYPKNFPSDFSCSIETPSFNLTKPTNIFNCSNHRAGYKNVWMKAVTAANGIFAIFAFLEILWILSRGRHGKEFMENWRFHADHLKSNYDEQRPGTPEPTPSPPEPSEHPEHALAETVLQRAIQTLRENSLRPEAQPEAMPLLINLSISVPPQPINIEADTQQPDNAEMSQPSEHPEHAQAQTVLQSAIQTLRENYLQDTEQPTDLKQPFGRPNPGEGYCLDLKMDEIYVNVAIHENRAHHYFAKDRQEQLKQYPPNAKDCKFANAEDILDKDHKNVLVVGRPGIGKTSLTTKMGRLWASGEAFEEDEKYKVVFLVKFRRFNDGAKLSLRELLAGAETIQRLDDSVWEFVQNESTKVLLIFDGLDEYSRKEEMNTQEDYKNNVEEKMPISVLYKKLAEGKLLRGSSILATTRPTAVKYVKDVNFQRTVEILGFTSENVQDYVEKFTQGNPKTKEKIWEHIKSNINLFSFCYVPMNCFLICHCLLKIILSESRQALPTKMTEIYKITVKMLLFNHNRSAFSPEKLEELKSTHMYEPFEKFPEELQKILNSLGEIAFKGIEEGRLLFESSEVSGLEDCGLLHKLPDLKPKAFDDPPKSQFCFTHLTVQEFFAAKHLVDRTKTNQEIEEFLWNYINNGTWQVVLQFAAGLLKSSQSSDIFIKLLPDSTEKRRNFISSRPKTLTSWPATKEDKDLAVQVCKCLYEINDEKQQPVLQNKIEKIKFNAVDFERCSLAPIDVAAVLHFLENAEDVLHISLSQNSLEDLGVNEALNFIVNRDSKLKSLNLGDNNGFTDNAAKDFAAALEHSNCKLESLELRNNQFTDNAAKDFAAALKHSNCKLESLDLSGNKFTDNAAKDFAAALKHSNYKLESLDLSYNKFTDNTPKDFAAALKHSNCKLESLHLSGNAFTDNAAKDFAAALEHSNCKLESLELSNNQFTDNAAKDFAAALKHSNCKLESLDLSRNKFTDNAAKDFAAALEHSNCKLESLDLSCNEFTDNAAKDFAAALKHSNCKLESLDLSFNKFTDNAAKDFAAALKHSNCKLESLDLRNNNFTDNAAKDFAAALKHSNCKLESLDLRNNNFTDNAAKDFAAALKHSNCKLELLNLNGKNFTEEGCKYLTDAGKQSNCKVLV
ncbi:NACHT, LRR and PYD domains-containing protein 12-like [Acropora millepora]|uniref:NACHT, LRR and PYD domains-containing protein 12-like n=1 Tax=Acropora millepora TaxID=45264 RepID=UPI001CF3FE60|nr:NACHT, LRR and PYD domains-containing protein 12-like [Acropora millepora]